MEILKPYWPKHRKIELRHAFSAPPEETNFNGQLYALIVNGEEAEFSKDLQKIAALLQKNRIPNQNVRLVDNYNQPTRPVFMGLDNAIKNIMDRINPHDKFLFVFNGYGSKNKGRYHLNLKNDVWLSENEISQLLRGIVALEKVAYFSQCFSSGIAYRLAEDDFIGISSTGRDQRDWGEFTHALFPSLVTRNVTIEEAFDNAVNGNGPNRREESPMLVWSTTHPGYVTLNVDKSLSK